MPTRIWYYFAKKYQIIYLDIWIECCYVLRLKIRFGIKNHFVNSFQKLFAINKVTHPTILIGCSRNEKVQDSFNSFETANLNKWKFFYRKSNSIFMYLVSMISQVPGIHFNKVASTFAAGRPLTVSKI